VRRRDALGGLALLAPLWLRGQSPARQPRFTPVASVPAEGADLALRRLAPGGLLMLEAVADGQALRLLVDTGSSHSVLTPAFARRAGLARDARPLAPDGDSNLGGEEIPLARVREVRAGPLTWSGSDWLVLDLAALHPELDGVLGMTHLGAAAFALDLARARLRFPGNFRRPEAEALAVSVDRRRFCARLSAGGERWTLLLDSGATHSSLPPEGEGAGTVARLEVADIRGRRREPAGPARRLAVAGPGWPERPVVFQTLAGEARLGLDALAGHRLVCEPALQRAWLLPAAP
jgi:hypothetical protein